MDPARAEGVHSPTVAEVFADHAPYVWSLLRRLGVPEADAEDVCQEVFVIVHRKLAGLPPEAAPRTWLYGIALRVASDYRRSARVRREQLTAAPPEPSVPGEQEAIVQQRQRLAWLDAQLDQLDDDKRAVFVLYEIEQVPMQQVAEIAGCPLQTAYSRLHAARRQLQDAAQRCDAEREVGT
jgi:RNA polymerase sigma-70 factor, ECF subfamily